MTAKTQAINPRNRTEQIGGTITRGGSVTIDQLFQVPGADSPEASKWIALGGSGGSLLVENADGDIIPFLGHQTGDWIPVVGVKIVASYTDPVLGLLTTTATDLLWYGGI